MPNVKWKAIPPVKGPNPQGVLYGRNENASYKQMGTSEKVSKKIIKQIYFFIESVSGAFVAVDSTDSVTGVTFFEVFWLTNSDIFAIKSS